MILHENFNPADPASWMGLCWFAWALIWLLAAFTAKRTRAREPILSRILYLIPIVIAAELLFWPRLHLAPALAERFVPHDLALQWIGVALTSVGIAFTFWARFHLGRNWSGQVVIKEQHELIRTGPYALVRHPIYTGLLLALFGTALVIGEVRALLAMVLAGVHFFRKARREEGFMSQEFGEDYARYRSQTGMLLPRVR